MDDTQDEPQRDNTNAPSTGTTHGVPHGAALEESKGVPDSGRHQSESAPLHNQH
jgi:hypothetical protein